MGEDKGFVLYDATTGLYYCGMNTWNNQLRKAQVYHSKKYLLDAVDYMHSPSRKKDVHIDLDKANLKVLTVEITVTDAVNLEKIGE